MRSCLRRPRRCIKSSVPRKRPPAIERPNVQELLGLLPQEEDDNKPNANREWRVGDACIARGQVGQVDSLGPGCASVVTNAGRMLFVGLDELQRTAVAEVEEETDHA